VNPKTSSGFWLYAICGCISVAMFATAIFGTDYVLSNDFLLDFVEQDLLNVLAITTSVTMAWSGHLVTLLTRLEDSIKGLEFRRLRGTLKRNIIFLGAYFLVAFLLLVAEAGISCGRILRACIYAILLTIFLLNVILMIQSHLISFRIPTRGQVERMVVADEIKENNNSS